MFSYAFFIVVQVFTLSWTSRLDGSLIGIHMYLLTSHSKLYVALVAKTSTYHLLLGRLATRCPLPRHKHHSLGSAFYCSPVAPSDLKSSSSSIMLTMSSCECPFSIYGRRCNSMLCLLIVKCWILMHCI